MAALSLTLVPPSLLPSLSIPIPSTHLSPSSAAVPWAARSFAATRSADPPPSLPERIVQMITPINFRKRIPPIKGERGSYFIRRRCRDRTALEISVTRRFGSLIGFTLLVAPFGRFFLLFLQVKGLMKKARHILARWNQQHQHSSMIPK